MASDGVLSRARITKIETYLWHLSTNNLADTLRVDFKTSNALHIEFFTKQACKHRVTGTYGGVEA